MINKKHLEQKVAEKFDVCDVISTDIEELQGKRRKLEAELRILQRMDNRTQWYKWRKEVKTVLTPSSSESKMYHLIASLWITLFYKESPLLLMILMVVVMSGILAVAMVLQDIAFTSYW